MIYLKHIYMPPEEKLRQIMGRLIELKQRCDAVENVTNSLRLLEFSTYLVDLKSFLLDFKDDTDLFSHANKRAASNPKYPESYDLKEDLIAVFTIVNNIRVALDDLDFSNSAELINGIQTWKAIDSTSVKTEALKINLVLDT